MDRPTAYPQEARQKTHTDAEQHALPQPIRVLVSAFGGFERAAKDARSPQRRPHSPGPAPEREDGESHEEHSEYYDERPLRNLVHQKGARNDAGADAAAKMTPVR
jgi:hypothetical protein